MVESPHLAVPLPEEEDWHRLLRAAAHSPYPCRDRAVLHLFWSLGLTVPDLLALRLEDVDFLTGRVRWAGVREGLLSPDGLRSLTAYVSLERAPCCPRLFGDRHGRPLSRAQVARIFTRLQGACGVHSSPQALRLGALYRMLRRDPAHALAALRPRPGSPRRAAGGPA